MSKHFSQRCFFVILGIFLTLRWSVSGTLPDCPSLCECSLEKGEMNCSREFLLSDAIETEGLPPWSKSIKFLGGSLSCDCGLKGFLERSSVKVFGTCSENREVHELTPDEIPCDVLFRKRREVVPDEKVNVTKGSTGPGGVLLPCDFEEGFCQWYHTSDSEFHWKRHQGPTPSVGTGPQQDHTTGSGWYVYIEASIPRRPGQAARLVSPTIAPNEGNNTCEMDFFKHMHGQDIGTLNIYEAPVDDFKTLKASWAGSQASTWIHQQVKFDSNRAFQVVIEALRGRNYKSDIALDDIKFSSGCRRLVPSYVRVSDGDFKSGRVEIYQKGDWKPVCQDTWTMEDSAVACKELGFVNSSKINDFSSNKIMEGLPKLGCRGNESSVSRCAGGSFGNVTWCPKNETAAINCTGISAVCPSRTHLSCPKEENGTAKCISKTELCDFKDDCWDGSDEKDCDNYTRCDFEDPGLCGWIQAQNEEMNWTRHQGSTPSIYTGPSADHKGNPNGYYLYTEVSGRNGGEKARILVTPRFQGDHGGLCRMSFFYHMYGWGIGSLRVFAQDAYSQKDIWSKSYFQENKWKRAEVTLANLSTSFQVMFESDYFGGSPHGDIAIDDVSFTPECRPAVHENVTCKAGTFACGSGDCVPVEDRCDFRADCYDGSDEFNCGFHTPGRCNFELDFCDWSNLTDDDFDWERRSGGTPSFTTGPLYDHTKGFRGGGYYMYIEASSPRRREDKARIQSPQFMWANVQNCTLRFYYYMFGIDMGRLLIYLKNTITSEETLVWQKSGNQGNQWRRADIPLATNWTVAQVVIEGVRGSGFSSDIAIDDISFSPACYPSEDVHLVQNYAVRLAGHPSSVAGRVEIYRVGQWGTICDDEWDQNDADVVCRQLGYSKAESFPGASFYGKGNGQIWLDNLKCLGNETDLSKCPHNGWAQHNCNHLKDAGVSCSLAGGSTKPVRLVGITNSSHGNRVEIYNHGVWGAICFDDWDLHDAFVVCRMIGYSGAKQITRHNVPGNSPRIWLANVHCRGSEDSLGKCPNSGWGGASCSYGYAGVVCSDEGRIDGEVRLAGGSSLKEGRIEIFYRGEWGTVCQDRWSTTNARVVCYELGFTSVVKYRQSFGPGSGRVWINDVSCSGNESGLALCSHSGWGLSNCLHDEDVGIICSDDAYVGCYKDPQINMISHHQSMTDLTPVKCLRYCQAQGYSFAGLSWATDCYCVDHYDKDGKVSESECSTSCAGDSTKKCGGGNYYLSVYSTDPAIVPTSLPGYPPVTQSCSALHIFSLFTIISPISLPNFFKGNSTNGAIWSPRYPEKYPVRLQCVWVLNLLPGTKAKIEFKTFQTEERFDFVEVRDGKRNYAQKITPSGGFTGNQTYPLTASSNVMWIRFWSDQSVTDTGFRLIYTAIGAPTTPPTPTPTTDIFIVQKVEGGCYPNPDIQTTRYDDSSHSSGYIYSPNHPSNYDNNLLCRWVIFVAKGYTISVVVQDLDVETSNGKGPGDVLIIGDGVTHQLSTGRKLPWEFKSSGHIVRVQFISDAANSGRGFKLYYQRVIRSSSIAPPTTESITRPDDGNKGSHKSKNKDERKGLSGGGIAGIVLGLLVLVAIGVFLGFCFKKKKKRLNQGVRHGFVNEAYDNALNLEPTNRSQSPENQAQPGAYAVVQAPPPYSQITPNQYATPFADLALQPIGGSQTGPYASLYSAPPAYEAPAHGAITSTTGLGSVTSLRDAAGNEVLPSHQPGGPPTGGLPAGLPPLMSRPTLPPIRGTLGLGEKKVALPDDQAGPLPDKAPLSVDTPVKPSAPPRPSSAQSAVRLVSPAPSALAFDGDVPFEFLCPITNEIMKNPVTAADGYTYEKRAIRSWLRRHSTNPTSPMTNESLTDTNLRQNDELREKIENFMRHNSEA